MRQLLLARTDSLLFFSVREGEERAVPVLNTTVRWDGNGILFARPTYKEVGGIEFQIVGLGNLDGVKIPVFNRAGEVKRIETFTYSIQNG